MPHPRDRDLFEWTITEAPFREQWAPAPEPPPPASPEAAPGMRRLSWWTTAVVVGLLAGLAGWQLVDRHLTRLAVQAVVAQEEAAAFGHDLAALAALAQTEDAVWLAQRLERAAGGFPAPMPIRALRPQPGSAVVGQLAEAAPGLWRAEVVRAYRAPDGRAYAFVLPQFYAQTEAGWRRTPPPEAFWGDPLEAAGRYVVVRATAVDAEFVAELLPYLDAVLAQMCAAWPCPAPGQAQLRLVLAPRYYQLPVLPEVRADDPLLFSLLPPHVTRFPDYGLLVPSPHDVGYPADAAARDLLRRTIAIQAVFAVADRLAFGDGDRAAVGNALFFALVAREAAALGLEAPNATAVTPVALPETLSPEALWGFRGSVWLRPDVLRNALAMLNTWLPATSAAVEVRLLREQRTAPSAQAWLERGAGLSEAEAAELIARAFPGSAAP